MQFLIPRHNPNSLTISSEPPTHSPPPPPIYSTIQITHWYSSITHLFCDDIENGEIKSILILLIYKNKNINNKIWKYKYQNTYNFSERHWGLTVKVSSIHPPCNHRRWNSLGDAFELNTSIGEHVHVSWAHGERRWN